MYHLLIGRTVADRYEVRTLLGRGGMGAVYRAHDRLLQRDVALKVIAMQASDPREEEALRRRFHREARIAAGLRHPNVVGIYDFVRDAPLAIEGIVMELLEGEDLGQRVERTGPLSVAEAVEVMRQAASGLAAGHRAGLLHRDIKPPNLYLTSGGGPTRIHVHVLDFGIAQEAAPVDGTATHLTAYGRNPLSPRFASPEQWRGAPLSAATDVFSLAMSGWFALTGEPPFSAEQLQHAARTGALPPLDPPADWPHELALLFRRALAAEAAARFPDAEALEAAVELVRGGSAPGPARPQATVPRALAPQRTPAPPLPRSRRRPGRHPLGPGRAGDGLMTWLGIGALLLVLGLGAATRWLDRQDVGGEPAAGVEAARPGRVEPVAPRRPAAFEMYDVDVRPTLTEASAARAPRELERLYPETLRRRGIGGTVEMRFLVMEDGAVDPETIEVLSATDPAFEAPSIRAAERMRYVPGYEGGEAVRVWVTQPIRWQVER